MRPEQKAERRDALLDAGRNLLAYKALEQISVAGIARDAGVAKGTFYLYFDTKEALFLALVRAELGAWFAAVDAGLGDIQIKASADGVADQVVSALRARPLLPRLLAVLHTVLEHNIGYATARDFKCWLYERSQHTGALLQAFLPFLKAGEGVLLILRMHALVIGFQHAANPAPIVREVLDAEPQLAAAFDVDFFEGLAAALRLLLAGWSEAGSTITKGKTNE